VEFCYALPSGVKVRDGQGKAVLRLAVKGLVPDSTLNRKKAGFGLPKGPWMNGPLKKRYVALLHSPSARALLSPDWRGRELSRLQAGRAEWTSWTIATLLGWIERHRPEIGP
jgi:asparagine synthase (glutamine-hydrolysing)